VLLARGAPRVYAVDVGRAQLHERLRQDPRVLSLERINARGLSSAEVPERCAIGVMDVSFISVLKILPALRDILEPGADLITLVKPQFEVGKGQVGKGGIVRDPELQCEALARVALSSRAMGYGVLGACASPILGARGNREFFLHLRPGAPGLGEDETKRDARQAVFA
jgi:23S rRNA (cytidine1920-2'-O)/16S rRNA (cytidine1409-2'-O)-methyltransferase